jgi:hypothetical protein
VNLGKLAERTDLPPTIPRDQWRRPLRERFAITGLRIGERELETILDFGAERPYHTMTAARHVALTARRVHTTEIDAFIVREGLQAAEAALADDDG